MNAVQSHHWYLRPLGALALLTSEYLAISVIFDAYALMDTEGGLGGLRWMGFGGPALMAFGTSIWVLGGDRLREAIRSTPPLTRRRFFAWLTVHLICFALFFETTAWIFASEEPPPGPSWAWVGVWLTSGATSLATLVPIAFGSRRLIRLTRDLAAPLSLATLVAFLAVVAGLATESLWTGLNGATLNSVAYILDILVSPIYFEPSELAIGTPDFWVRVAPVCSGYEGIGLILVFLSVYLAAFHKRLRFPNVLILLPAAIALSWFFNVLRIVALILIGHFWSPEIAIGGFHSKAGWLVFCGVALGAVWVSERVPWFAADPSAHQRKVSNPSAPFLLPFLATIATALVSGLFVGDFEYLYGIRVGVALLVLAWFKDDYLAGFRNHLGGRRVLSWRSVGIGLAVYVVWIGLSVWSDPELGAEPPSELVALSTPLFFSWIVIRILGAVVAEPLVEELAFRGFLLRRLIRRDFRSVPYDQWWWHAAIISSLAFGLAHQQWIGGFIAGMAYAYAQKQRGLLSDAVVAHATTNALIAIQVLLLGHWSLW